MLRDFQADDFLVHWERLRMVLEDAEDKLTPRQILMSGRPISRARPTPHHSPGEPRPPLNPKRCWEDSMKPTDKAKVTVLIARPVPLEQLKKFASPKPLRRPAPRSKR